MRQEPTKRPEPKYSVAELEKRMEAANKEYSDAAKMMSSLEMGNKLAMLGGASQGPYSTAEYVAKMKQAEQKVLDYKTLIEESRKEERYPLDLEKISTDIEKARFEIGDKKAEDDPNSIVSKTARELAFSVARTLGMSLPPGAEQAPYSVITKVMPQVEKMLVAKETMETRKEISKQNAMQRELLAKEKSEEKSERRKEDFINSAYNKIVISKPYAAMTKIDNALNRLEEAHKNPSAIKDVGALYETVKIFDPESVVREGEIKLTSAAASVWQNLNTLMSRLKSSGTRVVDPAVIKQMLDYAKFIAQDADTTYRQTVDPVLKQAEKRGVSKDDLGLIDPRFSRRMSVEKPAQTEVTSKAKSVDDMTDAELEAYENSLLQQVKKK
jgi:hypothetical protein